MLICIMHTVICQLLADSTKKKDVHTIVAGASSSMAHDGEASLLLLPVERDFEEEGGAFVGLAVAADLPFVCVDDIF